MSNEQVIFLWVLPSKQLFLNHQYSAGISFLLLLLLPSMLSNDCQTNEEFVRLDSENVLQFYRNEPLHPLLVVLVEYHEEDGLLSSKLRTQKEKNFLVQYQSTFFHSSEWYSMNNRQVPFFADLLQLLTGMQNPEHSVVTLVLQADLLGFLFHCCSTSS